MSNDIILLLQNLRQESYYQGRKSNFLTEEEDSILSKYAIAMENAENQLWDFHSKVTKQVRNVCIEISEFRPSPDIWQNFDQ